MLKNVDKFLLYRPCVMILAHLVGRFYGWFHCHDKNSMHSYINFKIVC